MSCRVLIAAFVVAVSMAASAEIHFSAFAFSTDGGVTWQDECPILSGTNRTFVLKLEWNGRDERKMTWGGLLHCKISCERSFASSYGKEWGSPLFWQKHDENGVRNKEQYLTGTPRPFKFHVDLAGFQPGTWHLPAMWATILKSRTSTIRTRKRDLSRLRGISSSISTIRTIQ